MSRYLQILILVLGLSHSFVAYGDSKAPEGSEGPEEAVEVAAGKSAKESSLYLSLTKSFSQEILAEGSGFTIYLKDSGTPILSFGYLKKAAEPFGYDLGVSFEAYVYDKYKIESDTLGTLRVPLDPKLSLALLVPKSDFVYWYHQKLRLHIGLNLPLYVNSGSEFTFESLPGFQFGAAGIVAENFEAILLFRKIRGRGKYQGGIETVSIDSLDYSSVALGLSYLF